VLATAGIYLAGMWRLNKSYDVPLVAFDAASFNISVREGERRARSLMCMDCHHEAGQVLFKADGVGTLVAPNLTRLVPTYTDSELERLIRKGIKKDGTAVIAMPAKTYAYLADEDLAAIITWMRSRTRQPDAQPSASQWGPLGRVALATNKIPFEADHVENFTHTMKRPADLAPYLVQTTCLHCHQMKSEHDNGFGMKTPALASMVQSYTFEQFEHLLDTGKGVGDRELGLMSKTAREAFAHFTKDEKKAIFDYLSAVK
jgi:cytochrome c553